MKIAIMLSLGLLLVPAPARSDDPPVIDHQPAPCTVPEKAISLCAAISDDNQVATARIYFRRAGEDFYQFVDMAFTGVSYCGTIAGPSRGSRSPERWRSRRRRSTCGWTSRTRATLWPAP